MVQSVEPRPFVVGEGRPLLLAHLAEWDEPKGSRIDVDPDDALGCRATEFRRDERPEIAALRAVAARSRGDPSAWPRPAPPARTPSPAPPVGPEKPKPGSDGITT